MPRKSLHRIALGFLLSIIAILLLAGPTWADTGSASGSGPGSASSGSASGSGPGSESGSASGSAALPVPSVFGLGALAAATTQIGKPYEWGGTGPSSWDCSGLVQWAYRQVGVSIPRTTWQQAKAGTPVPRAALSPGDVVVLNSDGSHVGLYAGGGQVLNAYDWGVPVGFTPLSEFDIYAIRRF
ncbi:NlpC/P60 family protein [Nocardia abscessus]|uniref:NlpC/P60 family protein n=1 Tax=Nocardia abscessus TaxID=120957 RepID=UPI002456DBD7|nr:NlpC/P60 family protein [Nocardia abscessus]